MHGFDHVMRVYRMAERLARAEEADLEIVQAAALLHDAQDSLNGSEAQEAEKRSSHQLHSAEIAARSIAG